MTIEHDAGIEELSTGGTRPPTPGEFNTAMVHLYRAKVNLATSWRRRLDSTTHWAVIVVAAVVSFAFGGTEPERQVTIPLVSILITCFLLLEARRYRFYDVYQTRAYLLEADYFAPLLWPEGMPSHPRWREMLAEDLRQPKFHISFIEALGWRIRRNYGWIFGTMLVAWVLKLSIHPTTVDSFQDFVNHAAIGYVPGWAMVAIMLGYNGLLLLIGIATLRMRTATGEFPRANEPDVAIRARTGDGSAVEMPER